MSCLNFKTFVLKYRYSNNFKTIFLTVYILSSGCSCDNNNYKPKKCSICLDFVSLSHHRTMQWGNETSLEVLICSLVRRKYSSTKVHWHTVTCLMIGTFNRPFPSNPFDVNHVLLSAGP